MTIKEAETLLQQWRELERELEGANEDSRAELQARIRELRDRYQALVTRIERDAGPLQGATGSAKSLAESPDGHRSPRSTPSPWRCTRRQRRRHPVRKLAIPADVQRVSLSRPPGLGRKRGGAG